MSETEAPEGGAFLLGGSSATAGSRPVIFAPEQFSSDARLMARTVEDFLRKEVVPVNARLEAHEAGLMPSLLRRAGELGILGTAVPHVYGGLDLSKSEIALLTETAAIHPSFAISAGVHSGVATLPLLFFGSAAQKQKYLPRMATGEWIGAFALTEADSGSDSLSARAKATLSPDGTHYVLNGTKMWITNGGFADLFTCFANVEGEGLTAFLIERAFAGVSTAREEHKLGLRGSSTTRVVLDGVQVPTENLLGERGKGHRPALYALNLGRFAIACTALGMCKENLRIAVGYAKQRRQFGRSISEFGLIRRKLAEMAVRTFTVESMLYRTAGYLDARFGVIAPEAEGAQEAYCRASEEYAPECAILKVVATETLDFVVDEALQIHGGYGFSEEYAVAQAYRDSRVFRIFEGTNEINRITIVDRIVRRATTGRLPLPLETRWRRRPDDEALTYGPAINEPPPSVMTAPLSAVESATFDVRSDAVAALCEARRHFGDKLMEQQEVVGLLADMIVAAYAVQSASLRSQQARNDRPSILAAAEVCALDSRTLCAASARAILAELDDRVSNPAASEAGWTGRGAIALRRIVADDVIERNGYPW